MLERIKRATRFYEKMYSSISLEKQEISFAIYIIINITLRLVSFMKLDLIIKSYLKKYSIDRRDFIVVINTYNQLNIFKKLFKDENLYFSVSTIIQSDDVNIFFTKWLLLLYVLANPKDSISVFNELYNHWYYKDNHLRLM